MRMKQSGWDAAGFRLGEAGLTFSTSIGLSSLHTLVINIDAVTVHFLVSLVLPVSRSYLYPVVFAFVPPATGGGEREGKGK